MEYIEIEEKLSIKKLDPNNEKDIWLVKQLDNDPLIEEYLYPIEKDLKHSKHLTRKGIYQSPYAIYHQQNPIGYIDISHIIEFMKSVNLSYALLEQERGKGYATKVLKAITEIILEDKINDIKKVYLVISYDNVLSQLVAKRSGFIDDGLSDEQHYIQGYIEYQKTKEMLYRERHML